MPKPSLPTTKQRGTSLGIFFKVEEELKESQNAIKELIQGYNINITFHYQDIKKIDYLFWIIGFLAASLTVYLGIKYY